MDDLIDLAQRLDFYADTGDMGRKPDPSSLTRRSSKALRQAAAEIEALRAENERLREQVAANRDTFATLDIIDDPIGAAVQCEAASKNCTAALKEPKP